MIRQFVSAWFVAIATLVPAAFAHFPFVVPDAGGTKAKLLMSETLEPDPEVKVELLGGITLSLRDAKGNETPLTPGKPSGHAMPLSLAGDGTRLVHGKADLGVMRRGDKPAHLLIYYPKTIVGDAFDPMTALGDKVPVELVPVRVEGGLKLKLLAGGKPAAGRDVRVITPDGAQDDFKTDADGLTPIFAEPGRYGAWARHWVDKAGERDGKPYAQERHYATIVFDAAVSDSIDKPRAANAPATHPASAEVRPFAKLPQPVASFGAVASDGWLYVYGGHTGERHDYSTSTISGRFARLKLSDPQRWEELPGGPAVQGMNLVAHQGKIYRVGGMRPRNAPGEPEDNVSIAECARFDPATGKWEHLPSPPTPRSSHDIAIVDDKLYVVGGWHMKGGDEEAAWLNAMDVLDLSAPQPRWEQIAQPFARRALTVAVSGKKIHVMGGFDADDTPRLDVDTYDTATGQWSKGPAIPGKKINGFAPAACVMADQLYLSVATGELFRLNQEQRSWEPLAKASPRIVHRLVPFNQSVLILGGAAKERMVDLIETVQPQQERKRVH
ncbi:MAG: hypothetical protein ACREIT_05115 [Tepidisphaeraceae bacterium]